MSWLKNTLYVLLIILVLLFMFGKSPQDIFNWGKEKVEVVTYNPQNDPNIVFMEGIPLKINVLGESPNEYDRFKNISKSGVDYVEDENSDFLVVNFTDNSGYLNNKCMRVFVLTARANNDICDICSNKTNPSLHCDIKSMLQEPRNGILMLVTYVRNPNSFTTKNLDNEDITKRLAELIGENAQRKCDAGISGYCSLINYK